MIDEEVNVDGVRVRGPTVPVVEHENTMFEDQPKKRNYSDTFYCRPIIREMVLLPQRNAKGMLMKDSHGNYVYKKMASNATVSNLDLFLHNINLDSHPAECFNILFTKSRTKNTHPQAVTIEEFQYWKNKKAMISNTGRRGGKYKGFEDFTKNK